MIIFLDIDYDFMNLLKKNDHLSLFKFIKKVKKKKTLQKFKNLKLFE